jgi:hypothetical protein
MMAGGSWTSQTANVSESHGEPLKPLATILVADGFFIAHTGRSVSR